MFPDMPADERALRRLQMREYDFNGLFFEEPMNDELAELQGTEVLHELERDTYRARTVRTSAVVRATPQHILYGPAGRAVLDYEMLASYEPLA